MIPDCLDSGGCVIRNLEILLLVLPAIAASAVAFRIRPMSEVLGPLAPVPWFFTRATLVTTHSHRDAQLSAAKSRYPVLVFSHGYTSFSAQNSSLTEELASHGYVVFSLPCRIHFG